MPLKISARTTQPLDLSADVVVMGTFSLPSAKGDKAGALSEYRVARSLVSATGVGGAGGPNSLLDLKISDLVADAAPGPSTAPKSPTAQTQATK